MAAPVVALARRRTMAMKPETAYGVDIFAGTVVAADVLHARVENLPVTPQIQNFDALGASVGFLGTRASAVLYNALQAEATLPIRGAGAAYAAGVKPEISLPLRACGLSETGDFTVSAEKYTYAPRSTGFEAMTIYVMQETGLTYEIVGCFGTARLELTAGQPGMLICTFNGKRDAESAVALVTPVIAATPQYPLFLSAAFQIGTENYAAKFERLVMDLGVVLGIQVDENDSKAITGFFPSQRNPQVTLDVEMVPQATFDWYAKLDAGTLMDMTLQLGTVQYNRMKLSYPKVQVIGVTEGDRGGAKTQNVTLASRVDAGDDEYSIVLD